MNRNINLIGKLMKRAELKEEQHKRDKVKNRKTAKLRKKAQQAARRRA